MKRISVTVIYLLLAVCAAAQTDSTAEMLSDSIAPEKERTTLTLGALFNNNASYYGQTGEEKLPYILANATVRFPFGLYISGSAYKLLDSSSSALSAANIGAGVDFRLGKKTTLSLGYSHTFYPDLSPFLQAANASNASIGLQYKHWLTTGISADYAFGKQEDIFLAVSNAKYISLGSVAKGKDIVSLTPAVELVAGTQHFYETYIAEKNLRDSLLGLLPLFPPEEENTNGTTTKQSTSFDLISCNLNIPLAYSRNRYMIEAAYQLSVLSKKAAINREKGSMSGRSFFNFSIYYQF